MERGTAVASREIKVLASHVVFEVMHEFGPQFARNTGHGLSFSYDPANIIKSQVDNGAAFDVAIVTRQVIDDLTTHGKLLSASCRDFGCCGLGVSIRKGAPKPDIGSVEAFKRVLLAAESVMRSKDGTSGIYFGTLIDRLGIAEQMRGKIKLGGSGRIAELVAKGEAELAVQQVSELLPVQGADFVGPFPPELQLYTMFAAGVATASKHRDAAQGFVDALLEPTTAALLKANGLEPIVPIVGRTP
jgi:molybdate transport system substrate-binding protein